MESKLKTPLVVIVGPTASGKSKLAMEIATLFDGEIITSDSWTVYKDFNIGTAKPSIDDQKLIRHHLLDVTTPREGFSAAVFKTLANKAINDIRTRNKLPIIVGGTGLYIDSLIFDYSFLPQHDKYNRLSLNALSIEELLKITLEQGFDISNIDTNNKRRIIRLIENDGKQPTKNKLRPNTLIIGIEVDKEDLAGRIAKRVDIMIRDGLEQEVNSLQKIYGWNCEPMKGIGYKEWKEYFNNNQSIEQTKEIIIASTKKLVKKQDTWFKRNKSIHWVNNQRKAVELVTTFLGK
jgi:tRNA dimethylallyltransferase